MKLKAIYNEVEQKVLSKVDESLLVDYIQFVVDTGNYQDLSVRIPHDVKSASFLPHEVCTWYYTYDCNDDHITTLFRQIIKNNYPKAWSMIIEHKNK